MMSEESRQAIPRMLWLGPAVMLLIALLPLPYGYYMLLRWIVCLAAAAIAWMILRRDREALAGWLMTGCAVLYNPVTSIHLDRGVWMVVNLATVALFVWAGRRPAAVEA